MPQAVSLRGDMDKLHSNRRKCKNHKERAQRYTQKARKETEKKMRECALAEKEKKGVTVMPQTTGRFAHSFARFLRLLDEQNSQ